MPENARPEHAGDELLSFQEEFVRDFMKDESPKNHLLVAPPGAGKQFTAVHLLSRMDDRTDGRCLILCPKPLVTAWHQKIMSCCDRTITRIDRMTFLELQSRVPSDGEMWPSGIILMSLDLARRQEVGEALSAADWDLVIVDESHFLRHPNNKLPGLLCPGRQFRRVLFLSGRTDGQEVQCTPDQMKVSDWTRQAAEIGSERKDCRFRPIHFTRSDEEQRVIESLADTLEDAPEGTASAMMRAVSSSLFALEQTLLRIRRSMLDAGHVANGTEGEWKSDGCGLSLHSIPGGRDRIEFLLELLATVTTDTKLSALRELLGTLEAVGPDHRVLLITEFTETARYLYSALAEMEQPVHQITGDIHPERQVEALVGFRDEGTVVVGTDAALEGIDLGFVDRIVHYDLPSDRNRMGQRRLLYDKMFRKNPWIEYALIDDSGTVAQEAEALSASGFSAAGN